MLGPESWPACGAPPPGAPGACGTWPWSWRWRSDVRAARQEAREARPRARLATGSGTGRGGEKRRKGRLESQIGSSRLRPGGDGLHLEREGALHALGPQLQAAQALQVLRLGAHLGVLCGAAAVGAPAGVGGVAAPRVLRGVDREGGEGHPHVHPAVAAVEGGGGGQREARLEGGRAVPVTSAGVGRVQ
eukprot:scaffold84087_cov63-Phaeocystis_antarctica.AAC.3